ncbi:MAG: hypothetical protein ACLFP2_00245 [Candidatus Woesearchaeota archaeon]
MYSEIPISKEEFDLVEKTLRQFATISEFYLSKFTKLYSKEQLARSHPLVATILISDGHKEDDPNEFLIYLEELLKFHKQRNTPGLKKVIEESNNNNGGTQNFNHSLSELEICKFIIDNGNECKFDDDLLIKLDGEEFCVELKTYSDFAQLSHAMNSVREIESNYWIEIEFLNGLFKDKIEKIESTVKEILLNPSKNDLSQQIEIRLNDESPVYAWVRFNEKDKTHNYKTTGVISSTKEAIGVDHETAREQIMNSLEKARYQLTSKSKFNGKKKLIFIDLKNSINDLSVFKRKRDFIQILYGKSCVMGKTKYHKTFDEYKEWALKGFLDSSIDPTDKKYFVSDFPNTCKKYFLVSNKDRIKTEALTFLSEKGLFFNDDFNLINGVVLFEKKEISLFLNPFVDESLLIPESKFPIRLF